MIEEYLYTYLEKYSSPPSPLLQELWRMAHVKLLQPRMLSGALQGKFLQLLCQMISPERVLELGAYSGYSTIALAEALSSPTAQLHSIECNDELALFLQPFLDQCPRKEQVFMHYGRALDLLPVLLEAHQFDLVYIDADKREYVDYYELILPALPSGAVILADNTLWSGKVLKAETGCKDPQCSGIMAFNKRVAQDSRVEQVLLPLRDGLTLIRKR